MRHAALIRAFAITACSLCLIVVVLGAYVRLTPIGAAQSGQPLELGKAWREMLHRYAAGTLGLLIVCLAAMTLVWRRERIAPLSLSLGLPGIVILQGIFGMLSVTWRLKPLIVTLHLLFGLTTLSLLSATTPHSPVPTCPPAGAAGGRPRITGPATRSGAASNPRA
jgi:cytochrome c oxidase assembly protein subunit 15